MPLVTSIDIIVHTMSDYLLESYQYEDLPKPPPGTFRVVELLPGESGELVSCLLHLAHWSNPPTYEALSYAWGDLNARATIICHGKKLEVTQSLYGGLTQLRYQDRSRYLFADALW